MMYEGMSVARLNLSHGTIEEHKKYVSNAREAAHELSVPIGILIDFPNKLMLNFSSFSTLKTLLGKKLYFKD